MDIQRMLADLQNERERIDQAISALQALGTTGSGAGAGAAGRRGGRRGRPPGRPPGSGAQSAQSQGAGRRRGRRRMSAAAKKRISEMMKLRWAERKKKAGK